MYKGKVKNRSRLKRLIALLLCALMVESLATVLTTQKVSADDTKDAYGFPNEIPDWFLRNQNDGENPYGQGKKALGLKHESFIVAQNNGGYAANTYNFESFSAIPGNEAPEERFNIHNYGGTRDGMYTNAVTYNPKNAGVDNYSAEVELKLSNGHAYLSVFRRNLQTGGDKKTKDFDMGSGEDGDFWESIEQWAYKSYFEIAAGDFNGDGKDELAVYIPQRGSPRIEILNGETLEPCVSSLPLASAVGTIGAEMATKFKVDKRTANATIQVNMDTADLDRDGTEELITTASFGDITEDSDGEKLTDRRSFLTVYKCANPAGNWSLNMDSNLQMSANLPDPENKEHPNKNFDMRTCSVTTGDLDFDGYEEVIVAGYYTYSSAGDNPGGRDRLRDENFLVATFRLNKDNKKLSNPTYQFLEFSAFVKNGMFNSQDDQQGPPALCAVAMNGINTKDSIFLAGTFYDFSGNKYSLAKTTTVTNSADKAIGSVTITNEWVDEAVAGNFDSNPLGVEQVMFTTGYKQASVHNYAYRVNYAGYTSEEVDDIVQIKQGADGGYYFMESGLDNGEDYLDGRQFVDFTAKSKGPSIAIGAADCDNDTQIIQFTHKEYTFAKPQVLALLQAAPFFGDLDEAGFGYGDNCSTAIGKSHEEGHVVSTTNVNSAGIVFDAAVRVGIVKVAYEQSFTHEWEHTFEEETTQVWSWDVENTGKSNKIVLSRTPIIMYYYDIWTPDGNGGLTKDKLGMGIPREPAKMVMTVDRYNELVKADPNKSDDFLITLDNEGCVAGQPSSYPSSGIGRDKFVYREGEAVRVDNSSGSDGSVIWSQSFETGSGTSDTYAYSNSLDYQLQIGVGAETAVAGAEALIGGSYGHTWGHGDTTTKMDSVTKSGSVAEPPEAQGQHYGFTWQLAMWQQTIGKADDPVEFPVVGYMVTDVDEPLSIPQNVTVQEVTKNSITINWDEGYTHPDGYEVYQYVEDPVTGPEYIYLGFTDADTRTFKYDGLDPETTYELSIRAYKLDSGILYHSMYTAPVSATTLGDSEVPIITSQPEDQYVLIGEDASFSVVAKPSENASQLSFMWQKKEKGTNKWVNTGNKQSTLTLTNVTQDMDGSEYRVVVGELLKGSSSKVNIFSDSAVLHVGQSGTTTVDTAKNTDSRDPNEFLGQNRGYAGKEEVVYQPDGTTTISDKKIEVKVGNETHTFLVFENDLYGSGSDVQYVYYETALGQYYVLNGLNASETEADSMALLSLGKDHFEKTAGDQWADFGPDELEFSGAGNTVTVGIGGKTYEVYIYDGEYKYKFTPAGGGSAEWYEYAETEDKDSGDVKNEFGPVSGDSNILDDYAEPLKADKLVVSGVTYVKMRPQSHPDADMYDIYVRLEDEFQGKYFYPEKDSESGAVTGMQALTIASADGSYMTEGGITAVPGNAVEQEQEGMTEQSVVTGGDKATLTAEVKAESSGAEVSGSVAFIIRNTSTGNEKTVTAVIRTQAGKKIAEAEWTPDKPGTYEITAVYSGNDSTLTSSGSTLYYALDQDEPVTEANYMLTGNEAVYGDRINLTLNRVTFDESGKDVYQDVSDDPDASYKVTYKDLDGKTVEKDLNNHFYVPDMTGTHTFTAAIGGKSVSFSTDVTRRPVTLTAPSKSGLSSGVDNAKIPDIADVEVSYTGDESKEAILEADKSRLVVSDMFDLTSTPEIAADSPAGTYVTQLSYKTDNASQAAIDELKAKYSVTLENGAFKVLTGVFNVRFSAGANGIVRGFQGDYMREFDSGSALVEGTKITISAVPEKNFKVDKWTVLDGEGNELVEGTDYVMDKTGNDLTFIGLVCNVDVSVSFTPSAYDLKFSAGANGSISGNYYNDGSEGSRITSPESIPTGKSVKLTAIPDEGYVVKQWTIDTGSGQPKTYTEGGERYTADYLIIDEMESDMEVMVEFEEEEIYTVTTSVVDEEGNPVAGCSISVDGLDENGTVKKGRTLVFSAVLPDVPERDIVKEWRQYTSDTEYIVLQGSKPTYRVSSVQSDLHIEIEVAKFGTVALHYDVVTDDGTVLDAEDVIKATCDGEVLKDGAEYSKFIDIVFEATGVPDNYQVVRWTSRTSGTNEKVLSEGAEATTVNYNSLEEETWIKLYLEGRVVLTYDSGANGALSNEEIASGGYFNKYRKDDFTFTVSPDKGYELDAVTVTGNYLEVATEPVADSSDVTLKVRAPEGGFNSSVDVNVTFKAVPFTGAVASLYDDGKGTHGTIDASIDRNGAPEYAVTGTTSDTAVEFTEVYRDSKITAKATPDVGYSVLSWEVNGTVIDPNALPEGISIITTDSSEDTLVLTVTEDFINAGDIHIVAQNGLTGARLKYGAKNNTGGSVTALNEADGKNVPYGTIFGADTEIAFTAAAEGGFELVDWEVNGVSAKEDGDVFRYTVSSNAETDVRAVFEAPKPVDTYVVTMGTVTDDGKSHGGLSAKISKMPDPPGKGYYSTADYAAEDIIDSGKVLDATTGVSFTAEPDLGFRIAGWYSDEACTTELFEESEDKTSYEISSIGADASVYVKFIPIEEFTITVKQQGTGSGTYKVSVDGTELTPDKITDGSFKVARGSKVVITAVPDGDRNYVSAWNDDPAESNVFEIADVTGDQTVSVTISPVELVAIQLILPTGYDKNDATVTADGETINAIEKPVRLGYGAAMKFTVKPHDGEMVDSWKIEYADETAVEGSELGHDNELSIDSLALSANVYVTFKSIAAYSVPSEADSTETYTISDVSVDPDTLGPGYENKVRENGSTTFTVKPAERYAINSITDLSENTEDGTNVVSVTEKEDGSCLVTISNITADVQLSVETVQLFEVTIKTSKKGSLTVMDSDGNKVESGDLVKDGTVLNVKVAPALGYGISSLNAPMEGRAAKASVTVSQDVSLSANFRKLVIVAKGKTKAKKATIKWTKVEGAQRYVVYYSSCGKKTYTKFKTVSAKKTKLKVKIAKVNSPYKFKIAAQKKVDGKYKTICTSYGGHFVSTKHENITNPKSITTKSSLTVAKGETVTIKAKVKKIKAKKKLLDASHAVKLRYVSADNYIAAVNSNGVVTGKHPGKCKIYVQTINGLWKVVTVTVK